MSVRPTIKSQRMQALHKGKAVKLQGLWGSAIIERTAEGFLAKTAMNKGARVARRFSDPSAAIYWAYTQIRPAYPGWLP